MERKIMVSVIMPVYNSAKYLDTSISSVLKQDYKDYELILVDDGSTDKSGYICDKYAHKYKQIKVIHKENGGLCSARNTGLEIATGKYIAFIDNDDEYMPGMLSNNINLLEKYNADLIRFDRIRKVYLENGKVVEDRLGTNNIAVDNMIIFNLEEIKMNFEKIRKSGSLYTIWNGIYKRSIIKKNDLIFDNRLTNGGEDWTFNYTYLSYVKKMIFNPEPYYIYMRRYSHSVSTKFNENKLFAMNVSLEAELGYLKKSGLINKKEQKIATITNYVYSVIDIMCQPACNWPLKKKSMYLNNLRKNKLYKMKFKNKNDLLFLKQDGKIKYLIMKNFYFGNNLNSILMFKLRNIIFKKGSI